MILTIVDEYKTVYLHKPSRTGTSVVRTTFCGLFMCAWRMAYSVSSNVAENATNCLFSGSLSRRYLKNRRSEYCTAIETYYCIPDIYFVCALKSSPINLSASSRTTSLILEVLILFCCIKAISRPVVL